MPNRKKKSKEKRVRRHAVIALGEFRPRGSGAWGMFLVGYVVACYISFVICSLLFISLPLTEGLPVYLLFPVLAPVIYWLMSLVLQYFQEEPINAGRKKKKKETRKQTALRRLKELCPVIKSSRAKLSPAVFAGATLAVFAVLGLALLAQYPGGFVRADIGWQWMQIQTGQYDSWHPPIHTFLIWLVTRIVNSYGFFIGVQVLFFSLLCGYMAATLRAWGIQALWVVLFVLAIVSAHSTRGMMLFAYKDSMFTCFALWLAICIVNIALSHGKWLGRWDNRVAFAVAMAFVTMIRLNGFFFTIPALMLVFALYGKKQAIAGAFSGTLALLIVLGVRGPLYQAVGVKNFAGQTQEEFAAPPLNIVTSIYKIKPDALDEDGVKLMQWLATPEQWEREKNNFGDYRNLKGGKSPSLPQIQEKMDQVLEEFALHCPSKKLLSIFWHAIKNEPTLALKAFVVASQTLWNPTDFHSTFDYEISVDYIKIVALDYDSINEDFDNRLTGVHLRESILAETKKPFFQMFQKFQTPYRAIDWVFRYLTPGSLLQCVSINIIALMLCMWFSLRRRRGWEALLLALPSLACSLPNFYALIGPDYRWLHFNAVITVPLVLVCLAKADDLEGKTRARH